MAQINIFDEIIVDNFAGGGGASTGIELATGRPVAIAINHDPDAILMHKTNHPYTEHLQASVWDVDPARVCAGRSVGLAWFSPDCKHFSKAKGAALVDRNLDISEPMHTVTVHDREALTAVHITKFKGTNLGQSTGEPLQTVTAHANNYSLTSVKIEKYHPGINERDYTGKEYGKTKQVARCGNSVCPPMAEALVRANLPEWCTDKITTMRQLDAVVAV